MYENNSNHGYPVMVDTPKQEPFIAEHPQLHKLDEYLRQGYYMLNDTCHYALLRTPDHQVVCANCNENNVQYVEAQHPGQIYEMSDAVIELTEAIQVLKKHETECVES
ncbi:unnamed protein product [Rotaria socialis]|uniref:Uncharacterized protein n=1 Tax=Rotaria socialis TaxID=392032 RepID=A0A818AC71_9BILA|nr:unnamed protein product [Rotaria socialis]CAF4243082.1 unnamed protein product [Rotaria socialis]